MFFFARRLAFLFLLTGLAHADSPRKLIIDQDAMGPAGSDMQSMAMLINAPGTDVLGITVVSGDGWCDEEVAHALRLLEILKRTDIPVVPGATYPLVNSQAATKCWEALYGKLVYKGAWSESGTPVRHAANVVPSLLEGEPATKADPRIAANFLIEQAHKYPGEISLVAMGPLTNLALAIRLDPEFSTLIKELVIMGGSLSPQATHPTPFALEYLHTPRLEFNFRWDPEAVHIVFHSPWKKITLVPIDPTTSTELTPALIARASAGDSALAAYVKKFATAGFPMWDELAAATWLQPDLVKKSTVLKIDVDTSFTAGYGNTICWPETGGPGLGEQSATVVQELDVARLNDLFVQLMQAK